MENSIFKKLENETVLVTGGAGFIGSNLIAELLKLNSRVICFDDLSTGSMGNLADVIDHENFVFIKGNVNNFEDINKVFKDYQINYVFHYAARVGVIRTIEKPLEVLEDIEGIKNILKLSLEYKVKNLVFSSSSEVYGEPVEIPEREDGHLNPKLPYAVVKLVGENFLKSYYHSHGLKTCSLRFFNAYGPKQDSSAYGFVTGVFIRQALKGEPLTVFGDGSQTRDFVFIEDNVQASILALLKEESDGHSINIGTGRPLTIIDLAELIIKISGRKDLKIDFQPLRKEGEVIHRFPDVSKMRRLLGYQPRYSIEEGLRKTFEWYKNNLNK